MKLLVINPQLFLLLVVAGLVPAYYVNRLISIKVEPRKSFGRMMVYFILILAFVFLYTALISFIAFKWLA